MATAIELGANKWDAKKETMIANYRLDAEAWEDGLIEAGLTSVKPSRKTAYINSASVAKEKYAAKIRAASGEKWRRRFVEAMQGP